VVNFINKWRGNPWAILLTLSLGFFMTLLDLTIVNIAIPNMIDKLGASLDEVLWVVNAYVLVLAVLLITAGRLGDIRGPRALFAMGVAVFTLASLACGLSQNAIELITFRAVQGLGAALLMPQTMTTIIAVFPPQRRGSALGIWGAVAGVATIAGPTLGGLLVSSVGWRWIFFVNVPIGVVVFVLTFLLIPDIRHGRAHKFDIVGVLIATASLFCFAFGLTEGQRYSWNGFILGLLGAGVVLMAAFILHQRSKQDNEPLVPFVLFKDRNFTVLTFVAATVSVGMLGLMLPMNIYFQSVLGMSALKAGLVMAPSSLVSMFLAPFAGRLSDKIGGKFILMAGLTIFAVGMLWLVIVARVNSQWYDFLPAMIIAGVGIGGVFAPMVTESMRNVEPAMAGAASGVNNTIRQIGSVIGAAAVGALMQNRLASSLHSEATKRAGELPAQVRGQFVDGFKNASKSGLEVGAGQSGATQHLPAGTPPSIATQLKDVGDQVFGHGFISMMHVTMVLPIVVIMIGALSCFAVQRRTAGNTPVPQGDNVNAATAH
jgi:EmrB/QacA subfamily drug resistance transporter